MIKGYIAATHEIEDYLDTVISSTDLRIHYIYSPGAGPTGPTWDSGGEPGYGPEIEFDYVEWETADRKGWERLPSDDSLVEWAEDYLARNHDAVADDVAEREQEDRE